MLLRRWQAAATGQHDPKATPQQSPEFGDIREIIYQQRSRFLSEICQPLVLISQIQRSGGTLVTQLLDGHFQLHVHPSELHIGRPTKYSWPSLDLTLGADSLFELLFEKPIIDHAQNGYQKLSKAEAKFDPNFKSRRLPFLFDIGLQRRLFCDYVDALPKSRTQREILDAYVTAYFNAWLDYRGLYTNASDVKFWVAFAARLLTKDENIAGFSRDYPDGRALLLVRDPVSWFASARQHSDEYADPEAAINLWKEANLTILNFAPLHANFHVVLFEDLVADTAAAIARIAKFLGIEFESTLLNPTFNGLPILSDSSFGSKVGLDTTAADRQQYVDKPTSTFINKSARPIYEQLASLAQEHARRIPV